MPLIQPNKSIEYISSVDATIIQPTAAVTTRYQSWRRPKTQYVRSGSSRRHSCFKCPPEQIVVAEKGADAVLISKLPPVTNCQNQILSKDHFKLQPLAGDAPFLLPHGSHSFLAKIVHMPNNHLDHMCTIKYRVMVHRCPSYSIQNRGLKMKCSLDNLWGSSCSFSCKDGGYIIQPTNVFCNDHLEWIGEEPYCHYQGGR